MIPVYKAFIKFILFCRGQALDDGLIPHFYERGSAHMARDNGGVNALSGLYLISTQ